MRKSKIKRNNLLFIIVSTTFLSLYSLCILYPMIWSLFSSLKGPLDFLYNPAGLPKEIYGGWQFENYSTALRVLFISVSTAEGGSRAVYYGEMLLNAVIYTAGCTFVSLFSHTVTSYIASRYKTVVSKILYTMVIVVMALPVVGSMPSEVQMTRALGLYDNLFGVCILKGGFATMNFLILYASFKAIPADFSEAAALDGAGHFRILLNIMLPMVRNSILAICLLSAITYWNDYTTVGVFLPSHPTVTFGLYRFQYSYQPESTPPVVLAASLISCLPVLLLFLAFRNKILGAVMMGGLKG